jgi:glycosyltransferase involved in cell wall biosynthesis
MKVYLLGRDGTGWSIDRDREYTARALVAAGHELVRTPLRADAVYCVWWNLLGQRRWAVLRLKRLAAVVTNDLRYQEELFERVRPLVDHWVVANGFQRSFLEQHGIAANAISYCPFYVDERVFRELESPRDELARAAGLDPAAVTGRFLVASFQRDSLGADRGQPKWQKDPDLLVDAVAAAELPELTLLLAGPRRHYILERCRHLGIPYLFAGREPAPGMFDDDIRSNTLGQDAINVLWNLADLYVVSSRMEGGPKAVIEAGLTGTPIVSTPVGLAADLVPAALRFGDAEEGAALIRRHALEGPPPEFARFVEEIRRLNTFDAFRERVDAAVRATAAVRR